MSREETEQERVAVIGMAGRFPGAADAAELWRNVQAGIESIRRLTAAELAAEGLPGALIADPRYVPAKGVLDGVFLFDAEFFGFPPSEAEILDPQQRLFLECAWEACEAAGYDPRTYPGRIGVYGGSGYNSYFAHHLLANPERLAATDGLLLRLSNDKDFLTTHVSYKLDLVGPSIAVQTACSTSLVAAHLACQSLLEGECDMALAGGVTISFPHHAGYLFQEGGILSSDGHCRAFDARSEGAVEGNGAGVVLLKRLSDALADGDTLLAVIRGSAVNNDGGRKAGYTAPSVEGQTRVIAEALAMAGVEAESVGYVEAHGSGTPLGDSIEVEALTRAFRLTARRQGYCALGSIKTNLGHTDCAAGVAGLIKTIAALRHRQIPPSLHWERPNPRLKLDESPFYVNTELREWPAPPAGTTPRRAGVSSLGIGGTNAHLVLEEAPAPPPPAPSRPWQLLLLSARTPSALWTASANLARHLASPEVEDLDLADVAHTLRVGRRAFRHRRAVVCRDRGEAAAALAAPGTPADLVEAAEIESTPTAFLFPGLGDHSVGMAGELYRLEPAFRNAIDRAAGLLAPQLGCDLRELLWPAGTPPASSPANIGGGTDPGTAGRPDLRRLLARRTPEEGDAAARRLARTAFAHPAVFAVEHALAELWMEWGVRPSGMLGYSLGEYVAACLAGVFSFEDALALVATRARLIDALPPGAMLAVPLPADEVEALLPALPGLSLAADNGPGLSVVAGPPEAVAELERRLATRAVACRRLLTTHAFHSPWMEPIVPELTRFAANLTLQPPQIPFVSNVSGAWIADGEATDPAYWARHLCRPVRFAAGLDTLLQSLHGEPRLLVEVGPGQTLGTLVRQHPARRPGQVVVASLRDHREAGSDQAFLLAALGRLWEAGAVPDWERFAAGERRRRVPLPTYPFERRRYCVEPGVPDSLPQVEVVEAAAPAHPRPALAVAYAAPESAAERVIAGVWREAFGIDAVGVDDNFFDLAGNSLLALQIVTRLSGAFGLDLPMAALLEAPSVAALARRIEEGQSEAVAPRRIGRRPEGLDVGPLTRALNESVRRHEVLRTTFPAVDGKPVQRIAPRLTVSIPLLDLRALPGARREPEAARVAAWTVRTPFRIDRLPLFRTLLVQVGDEELIWPIVLHHLVTDWISYYALEGELAILYAACRSGLPSPLPEPALQFADFAVWQRERLEDGGGLTEQLDYWRRRLSDAPDLLPLPTDRPRPAVQTPWGARRRVTLDPGLSDRLRALARRHEVTLFVALLAVFKALLARVSGQERLIVGTPLAYRQGPKLQNVLGFFLNQLVLYTDLSGSPPFGELLGRVRDTALGAYAHQDLPFARLLLNPEQQMRQTAGGLPAGELDSEPYWVDAERTQFDLTFSLWEEAALEGWMEYNVDLFDATTVDRLQEQFRTLLAGALEDPERRLWELPLLPPGQRQQLLGEWSGAAEENERDAGLLHQLFAARVAAAPDAPAVLGESGQLTYGELARRASCLAGRLRALGVGADDRVALLLPRGPAWVVGLLATLEAGGAYLSLDDSLPEERVEAILADARPRVVLTPDPGDLRGAPLLTSPLTQPAPSQGGGTHPDNLAYVIYTSGSTGRPNGVLVRHRSVVHLIRQARRQCGVGPGSRVPQLASPGFDASVLETWVALASGACLIFPPPESRLGPGLAELVRRERIDWLFLTPSVLAALPDEELPSLRCLMVGGESCPAEMASRWGRTRRLWNGYGPTEATIYATTYLCSGTHRREPPIGRPTEGVSVYVLDPYGGLAPAGVAGELCVAGAGLARGYLFRPGLSAERFAPDPFSGAPGERLYHTGDLARFRADGNLEFLGRLDRQVKVRGFRIELGEIEAALAAHPAVREAAVLARPSRPGGGPRLVAYVVPRPERPDMAADELAAALSRRLPDYMVPAAWVLLPALPLTAHGKVDRRALPEPETPAAGPESAAPANPAEAALAEVVATVLGLPRVGVHDNFFALGGDSILSIQVVARARRLGFALTPAQLFQHPTVARLAAVAAVAEIQPMLPVAEQGEIAGPVPLTPVQRWFFSRIDGEAASHFNLSLLLETERRLDPAPLAAALALLTRHHDALRLRFRRGPAGDDPWEQGSEASGAALSDRLELDLSALPPERISGAVAAVSGTVQASLDLTRGPLQRAVTFDLGAGRTGRLLWVVHHLVVDAVSWRVLLEDLAAAYERLARGLPAELPPKTTSFQRWAELLRAHAAAPDLAAELPFWRDLPWAAVAPLPRDFPSGANLQFSERSVTLELDREETRVLLAERIQEVLLAAVARAFAAWTGAPALLLDVEGHGREEIFPGVDLSRTVGWFTNVYPVVLDLGCALDPQLRRMPSRGLGFGLLRDLLPPLPEAEIGFNYLGQLGQLGQADDEADGFRLAPEGSGPQRGSRLPRLHLIEIEGVVTDGRLILSCSYSANVHRQETAERLLSGVVQVLRERIAESRQPGAGGEPALADVYELSPMQQVLLAETLRSPGSGVYCVQFHGRLSGPLDTAALRRAWTAVIDRHPALRTAFDWKEPEKPLQRVWQEIEVPWQEDDWRALPAAEQASRLEDFLAADRRRGFALDAAPLLRLALFRLGPDACRFVFTVHHLLLDGWCMAPLFAEVMAQYGATPRLPEPRPYRDFIAWLERQDTAEAERFWRQELAGVHTPTPLPHDRGAGIGSEPASAQRDRELPAALTAALEQLGRRHQLTQNTLLQGAWGLLLALSAGTREVVFGTTVAGRPPDLAGAEAMIGLFINTLPLCVEIAPAAPLLDWLRRLQERHAAIRQLEQTPLEKIQGWSGMPPGVPLFESLLAFENYPRTATDVVAATDPAAAEIRLDELETVDFNHHPLTLVVVPGERLLLRLAYSRRRFDESAAEEILGRLETLLAVLAEETPHSLGDLVARLGHSR